MKKFSLLILSVLLLSCSSDSNDEAVTKEGNFLEVNNGIAWRSGPDSGDCPWYVFSPKSMKIYECMEPFNGECYEFTDLWGVANGEGYTKTVLENSKNFLKIEGVDSNGESTISTYSVSEDGNFINATNVVTGETGKLYKASGPCK